VEGIVPDFLTLLHGVLDSPDIPLNVSRSYLQSDSNVKKISSHITKKVADRLTQLFKDKREDYEKKWDNLKIFIEYGMLTEEKFAEKAESFFLFKNTEGSYFTFEEYEKLIKDNQTDKDKNLVYLYTNHPEEQYTFVDAARSKGYDVLIMDDILATPLINKLEQKYNNKKFVRVDSDVVEHLIRKEEGKDKELSWEEKQELSPIFQGVTPENEKISFIVDFKDLGATGSPIVITRNEWMRRMKDMSQFQNGMGFYGDMPESLNLVVNTAHPLIKNILKKKEEELGETLKPLQEEIKAKKSEEEKLEEAKKGKKWDDIPQEEKDKMDAVRKELSDLEENKRNRIKEFGRNNKLAKQLVDLALLANGLLKGADLDKFVKRSVELIQK
jgi:molecular chaperone HtpG